MVELVTGAMLLTAAGAGMLGPLIAAILIHRSGATEDGTAVGASLTLAILAVAVTLAVAAALFVVAWQRRRVTPSPADAELSPHVSAEEVAVSPRSPRSALLTRVGYPAGVARPAVVRVWR